MKDRLVVKMTAKAVYRKKIMMRISLMAVAILLLFVTTVYGIVYIVNKTGNFTISLDPNLKATSKIVMSPHSDFKSTYITLSANALKYMDNISETWLPDNLIDAEGEHSGDNYIAYTFFIKNEGSETINYNALINIQSVIKRVDEAVRVAIYFNNTKTVYAKVSEKTKLPEPNTIPFLSNTKVMSYIRDKFEVGSVDKYTVVIWLEGDDPECIDDILGGEMKMLMLIQESRSIDNSD